MTLSDFSLVTMAGALAAPGASGTIWLPAVDAMLKVTLLFAAAGVITVALNRASAATRHHIWLLALLSALALPALTLALPRWQLPLVEIAAPQDNLIPAAVPDIPVERTVQAPPVSRQSSSRAAAAGAAASVAASPASNVAAPGPAVESTTRMSLTRWLIAIWAAGATMVLGRLLLGLAAVQLMSRRTARIVDAPWLPLAVELANELGVARRLTFVESRTATMPMAWGILRASVLMPADAVRWPVERLRIVLLHELAHVKRRDCLTNVIAQIACAVYWFNPLVWIAARHIRTERERACDDLVLATGTHGPDYAEELLEIARVMRAGRFPALMAGATLAMAHRSQLEGRLIAILDPKLPRSSVSRVRTALAAAAVACMLPPIAAMQPWAVVQAAPTAAAVQDDVAALDSPNALAPQTTPTPSPAPAPNVDPNPNPQPIAGAGQMAQSISEAVADAIAAKTTTAITTVSQTAVESVVQSALQSSTQGSLQTVVQDAVQGALQGTAAFVGQELKEGVKRAAADPKLIAALTAALKDTDKEVREAAMHALVQLRDPAIYEPLVLALKDASADVRESAVHGLSQLRDRRAVEPLLAMLKDQNPGVREGAVHALGQLRDPKAVDGLIAAMKDENPSVREQAAFALGQLRDARAVDPLMEALKDQNPSVREQAAFALGQLRDKRAAPALSALMKDPNADVREQAVFALGQIRDVAAIDGLMAALRDSKPDVRQQAAFALGQIRDPRAVEPLISALKDEAPDVRQQAAFALGQLRSKNAVEALVIAVKDANADVREQVVFALGQIRDPCAIDALTMALKDPSADVRQQAAFALGQIAR
ncbi:MAG TPA: M56 family metallopeptidase [Vicinamibacterales bacterium]|nr:M56 family metallopeptidase [Vicinamibacterales bacterium]